MYVNVSVFRIRIRMFLGLTDPHVTGTDPRIRIRTKMSRIPDTGYFCSHMLSREQG
jgi:hypothetical protein